MCFSTTVSFNLAGLLAVISAFSLTRVRSSSQIMLALIPLLFAMQQLTEGFVWLGLTDTLHDDDFIAAHLFLSFGLVLWPTWVPISFAMLERNEFRKNLLLFASLAGGLFSANALRYLIQYGAKAYLINHHIAYDLFMPDQLSRNQILVLYLIPVLTPFFISSIKTAWLLGSLVVAGLFLTTQYWDQTLASVWCFFAAIISSFVLYLMYQKE